MSNKKAQPPFTADKSFSPNLIWMNNYRTRLRFTGTCLRQELASFTPSNIVHLFIVYELGKWLQNLNVKFSLKDYLFGAVKLTKNSNPNKYSYSGYGIGFECRSLFSFPNFDWGKNSIIFGIDMSSSVHANNKNKNILILFKGQTKELENTPLTAKAEYSINFSRSLIKFCLSLHYNGNNSFLLVNVTKIHQFKAKDSEIKKYSCVYETFQQTFL